MDQMEFETHDLSSAATFQGSSITYLTWQQAIERKLDYSSTPTQFTFYLCMVHNITLGKDIKSEIGIISSTKI